MDETVKLTSIQAELKEIESRLKQVLDDTNELFNKVEAMKPAKNDLSDDMLNQLTRLAKSNPWPSKTLAKVDELLQKEYIAGLAHLVIHSSLSNEQAMLYVSRRAIGLGVAGTANEVYNLAYTFAFDKMDEWCQSIQPYKYVFLTDAIVTALLVESDRKELLSHITELATIMSCDKQDLHIISEVAKSVVLGNYDNLSNLSVSGKNRYGGVFEDFIGQSWIEGQREICAVGFDAGKLSFNKCSSFSKRVTQKSIPYAMVLRLKKEQGASLTRESEIGVFEDGNVVRSSRGGVLVVVKDWAPRKVTKRAFFLSVVEDTPILDDLQKHLIVLMSASIFDDLQNITKWLSDKYDLLIADFESDGNVSWTSNTGTLKSLDVEPGSCSLGNDTMGA